jgi:hypothetical protein
MIGVVRNAQTPDTGGQRQSAAQGISHRPLWKAQEAGASAAVPGPVSRGKSTANRIRPFFPHTTRGAMFPVCPAQQPSPHINTELVGSQEVFGRYADSMTS